MPLHITESNIVNGDWILECSIDHESDRRNVTNILHIIDTNLDALPYPLGIAFRLRYQSQEKVLAMTVPGQP
jgi:hypothetical protein